MTATCVVQARMKSRRFPGKVLMELGGIPMLEFMLKRLHHLDVDHLVVATGDSSQDDPVADVARSTGAEVIRGPEDDVLGRFVAAMEQFPADVTVRLTADCPLADPEIIHEGIALMKERKRSYVSNTLVRTFPDGLDVELVRTQALRESAAQAVDTVEREHVTPFIYRRPERYALLNLRNDEPLGFERWTVDTPGDLEFMRSLWERSGDLLSLGFRDILAIAGRSGPGPQMELWLRPAMPEDRSLLYEWRNDPSAVAQSGSGRPVSANEHDEWFVEMLENPASRVWIAETAKDKVGQVRVDVEAGSGTVSISVAPELRGRGYGSSMLSLLNRALDADYQVMSLVARIRKENRASLRCFRGVGYKFESADGDLFCLRLNR